MRRYFAGVIIIVIVIAVIVGMSAAGAIEFDRPVENEFAPNRSTYNSGQTGTRAIYQLLEESGTPVARWRSHYSSMFTEGQDSILVIIGPFTSGQKISEEEAIVLQSWISTGGRALIISRSPIEQFGDPTIRAKAPEKLLAQDATPEQYIDEESDKLIAQPTELTRQVRGLACSDFASRMSFQNRAEGAGGTVKADPPDDKGEEEEEVDSARTLYAPVIHLGDKDGAALADFKYGKGR